MSEPAISSPGLAHSWQGRFSARRPDSERVALVVLVVAMVVCAVFLLWIERGTTYFQDELYTLAQARELTLHSLLDPVNGSNGHLIAVPILLLHFTLTATGGDHFADRALAVALLLASAGFFYALARKRIGGPAALAPTILLLLFGSSWELIGIADGIPSLCSIGAGLAALLAVERGDRRGDRLAALALMISLASLGYGLAFAGALGTQVALGADRRRRAWIVLVPLGVYIAWKLWAQATYPIAGPSSLSNPFVVPYIVDALASTTAALAGLTVNFKQVAGDPVLLTPAWGYALAPLVIGVLAWQARVRGASRELWTFVSLFGVVLFLNAIAGNIFDRTPFQSRYLWAWGVALLLIAVEVFRGVRLRPQGLVVLFAALAFALAGNVRHIVEARQFQVAYTEQARPQLKMLELARGTVRHGFSPGYDVPGASPLFLSINASRYLHAVNTFGSFAESTADLAAEPDSVRAGADRVLAKALRLRLVAVEPGSFACGREHGTHADPTVYALPRGGAVISVDRPARVELRRFADTYSVRLGRLEAGRPAELRIPPDAPDVADPTPWVARVSGAGLVSFCSPAGA